MKLKNICKTYHNKNSDVQALKDINLTISNRGMTFILGASGCGKTTLLNIISNQDKDFEGVVEHEGRIEVITQDIELFENLSILDNLLLVSENLDKINHLLEKFQFIDSKKKVKKLSLGEKKRVQIIRSLLSDVSYLICDEPTAALDYDNSEMVMSILKELSNDICVVIVTHRVALVDQYADYVIHMGKGCILNKTNIEDTKRHKVVSEEKRKVSIKGQIEFLLKMIKSRWLENIFEFMMMFGVVIILFICLFIFPSLNESSAKTANWMSGKNVIITQPNEGDNTNGLYSNGFSDYDLYEKQDVYLVKNSIKGMLGYRIGWNLRKYNVAFSCYTPMVSKDKLKEILEKDKEKYISTRVEPYFNYQFTCETVEAFDQKNIDHILLPDYSNWRGLNILLDNYSHEFIPYETSVCIRNHLFPIIPYQLFSDTSLELAYGEMPGQSNEIILSKNLAEKLMIEYDLNSIEELINQEVPLYIQRTIFPDLDLNLNFEKRYPLIVSGITYMASQYENQVFFKDGGYEKCMVDMFDFNPEIATYQYIHFLIDPSLEGAEIAKQINHVLGSRESQFMIYNELLMETQEKYQDPSTLIVFVLFALFIIFAMYMIMEIVLNKRIVKENKILKRYGYCVLLMEYIKLFFLMVGIALIELRTLAYVCDGLNTLANSIGIANVVSYDIFIYLKAFCLAVIIMAILKGGIYATRVKKHP